MNLKIFFASMIVVLIGSAGFVFAWTAPTAAPPASNAAGPVNISALSQVKAGSFWAASVGSDNGYCIGGSCIVVWPTNPWTLAGTSLYYTGGNVGIGTTTPVTTLDVNGYAHLAPQGSAPVACDAAHKGSIAIENASSHICICNGTSWVFNYNGAACAWGGGGGGSQSFFATGGPQTFTVPTGVTSINVILKGAGGASRSSASQPNGGPGGYTSATLAVTSGNQLTVIVGKAAQGILGGYGGGGNAKTGSIDGGGGGRSAISISGIDVVTAGGGGGGGDNPTDPSKIGGSGGGLTGATTAQSGSNGIGGTQTAGGTLGGLQYTGGDGNGGGAGGGGWYGGGGASSQDGGGGGSGYCGGAGVSGCTTTLGTGSPSDTDGAVTISW